MTLIINITTPEGIVMASDSRQTLKNPKQMTRVSTNYANKLFAINERIIVGTAGLAFFADESGIQRSVSKYVDDFCYSNDLKDISVNEVALQLHKFISDKYPWKQQLDAIEEQLKNDVNKNGDQLVSIQRNNGSINFEIRRQNGNTEKGQLNVEPINLLVTGVNRDGSYETYELISPGSVVKKRGADEYGGTWIGQGDVVSRMILGYDGKMLNIPIFQKILSTHSQQDVLRQLQGIEYNIPWPLLTMQDAVELAVFLIKSTSIIQRYADGISMDGGDIQGVGGPIDVAIITKNKGVEWIRHKQIHYPSFE